MARFRISRPYTMSRDEVRTAAEGLADDLTQQFNLSCRWSGDRVTFKGSGAKGELNITDDSVDLKVELNFIAAAFEKPLKNEINRYLDENMH